MRMLLALVLAIAPLLVATPARAYLGGSLDDSIAFAKTIPGCKLDTAVFFIGRDPRTGIEGGVVHENWRVAKGKLGEADLAKVLARNSGGRKLVGKVTFPEDLLGRQVVYRYSGGIRVTVLLQGHDVTSVDLAVQNAWKYQKSFDGNKRPVKFEL